MPIANANKVNNFKQICNRQEYVDLEKKDDTFVIEHLNNIFFPSGNFGYGDIAKIKFIIFESKENITKDNFINSIVNGLIRIQIGELVVGEYHLSLFTKLNDVIQVQNKFAIKIPQELTISEIILAAIPNLHCKVIVTNINNELFDNTKMIVDYVKYEGTDKHHLTVLDQKPKFQNIQTYNLITNGVNDTKIKLPFDGNVKGYFFEGDIENINKFNFQLNGYDIFTYDRIMIDMYCKKINKNLLYFPFNHLHSYNNSEYESFVGSINHSNYDNINLRFWFDNNDNQSIKIHAIHLQHLNYVIGQVSLSVPTTFNF
jgi:hypothetical protein